MSHIERKTFYSAAECGAAVIVTPCTPEWMLWQNYVWMQTFLKIQVKIKFSIQFGLWIIANNDAIDTQKVHKNGFQYFPFNISFRKIVVQSRDYNQYCL